MLDEYIRGKDFYYGIQGFDTLTQKTVTNRIFVRGTAFVKDDKDYIILSLPTDEEKPYVKVAESGCECDCFQLSFNKSPIGLLLFRHGIRIKYHYVKGITIGIETYLGAKYNGLLTVQIHDKNLVRFIPDTFLAPVKKVLSKVPSKGSTMKYVEIEEPNQTIPANWVWNLNSNYTVPINLTSWNLGGNT